MENNVAHETQWTFKKTWTENSLNNLSHDNIKIQNNIMIKEEELYMDALRFQSEQTTVTSSRVTRMNNKEDMEGATSSTTFPTFKMQPPLPNEPIFNQYQTGNKNTNSNSTKDRLNSRGQIDVIGMRVEQNCTYKYFFVYEDQLSKFVVLKALHNNTAKEVATKLLDILSIIGAPRVLQSGNGRNFAEQVVQEIRTLWKDLIILHGEILDDKKDTQDFKELLENWVKKNPTKRWYEGLNFIQILHNSTFRCHNGKIPCDILFGQNIHEEFQRILYANNVMNNVWTEEEWINTMSNWVENHDDKIQIKKAVTDDAKDSVIIDMHKNSDSHTKGYDSDSCNEFRDDQTEPTIDVNVHSFNFVNVKSEINNMQVEESLSGDEVVIASAQKPSTETEQLRCTVCQKQYMKLGHLKNHMKTHVKGKKYECTLCDKTFHVLSLYQKHMRQCHNQMSKTRSNKDILTNIENKTISDERSTSDKTTAVAVPLGVGNSIRSNTISECLKTTKTSHLVGKRKGSSESRVTRINTDPGLECTYCKQKFNFPSVLKRHMRSHTNERPYICEVCNKSFKQLGHLSQHSLTHKDYRSFQCAVCGVKFESLDTLKLHSQSHKGESVIKAKEYYRLFECDNCKKVFTTKSVLERHIFTHTHERQFGCKVCGKRFKQAGHVKSHMLVHTGERKFECTVCSKRFSLSNSLKKHMYVHNGEKPYQCDVCGARFLEKRNLNGHLMTHTNERPFCCKICGKRYTLADTLRRHISAAHEDGRTYQCEICAKMFKQLAHLSVHKKVHNDERPFQCHLCDKNFKHKNVLKSHLAIHANVRPFECDICKATFVRKTNLQTHIASAHMNERPYVCTICGKRFKQISHLNGHVVVHSNSMPYQCDFCDRRCNRLDNLKKHMRLHTKNKE